VYDTALGAVIEVGIRRSDGSDPEGGYAAAKDALDRAPWGGDAGPLEQNIKNAALIKADRREWAHRRFGDASRYAE